MNQRSLCTYAREKLQKSYSEIKRQGFVGIGYNKTNLQDVFDTIEENTPIGTSYNGVKVNNLFVRSLGRHELNVPNKRFLNSINIHTKLEVKPCNVKTPRPIAIIYTGDICDVLTGNSQGYIVTEYTPGENLFSIFQKEKSPEERENFTRRILMSIQKIAKKTHTYLFDFAPRDIIVTPKKELVFCDTEKVVNLYDERKSALVQQQKDQFKEDYKQFLSVKNIESLEWILDH